MLFLSAKRYSASFPICRSAKRYSVISPWPAKFKEDHDAGPPIPDLLSPLFWATAPSELQYVAPWGAELHPSELSCNLRARLSRLYPTELRCTLLSYASTLDPTVLRCALLSYYVPSTLWCTLRSQAALYWFALHLAEIHCTFSY